MCNLIMWIIKIAKGFSRLYSSFLVIVILVNESNFRSSKINFFWLCFVRRISQTAWLSRNRSCARSQTDWQATKSLSLRYVVDFLCFCKEKNRLEFFSFGKVEQTNGNWVNSKLPLNCAHCILSINTNVRQIGIETVHYAKLTIIH